MLEHDPDWVWEPGQGAYTYDPGRIGAEALRAHTVLSVTDETVTTRPCPWRSSHAREGYEDHCSRDKCKPPRGRLGRLFPATPENVAAADRHIALAEIRGAVARIREEAPYADRLPLSRLRRAAAVLQHALDLLRETDS